MLSLSTGRKIVSNITVTPHFNKNGRMTGRGKTTTSGKKFVSRFPHRLGWIGKNGPEKMFSLIVEDNIAAYVSYNENTRELKTHVVNPEKSWSWEIDVNLRLLIRNKLDSVELHELKLPGDWVTSDGRQAVVASTHWLEMVDDEESGKRPVNWIKVTFQGDPIASVVNLKGVKHV